MDKYGKEFEKQFNGLCRTRDRREAWCDFIDFVGQAIDFSYTGNERSGKEVQRIKQKYKQHELEVMVELMKLVEESYRHNTEQDFLGELAMVLGLMSNEDGKYFSPFDLSALTTRLGMMNFKEAIEKHGWTSVSDPTCGSGAMLIAAANECMRLGIDYQNKVVFIGQDIKYTTALACLIQLTILRCPGYVVVGNTLTEPMTGHALFGELKGMKTFYTPEYFSPVWEDRRRWEYIRLQMKDLGIM